MVGGWEALLLPPATKLGQGNIFTGMCDSVNRGGASSRGVSGPRRFLVMGDVWSRGGLLGRGGGLVPGGCLVETPPGQLLLRAVRILLECFLFHCAFRRINRSEKLHIP